MRTWTRVEADQVICGGVCGRFMKRGEPMQQIMLNGAKKTRIRCVQCADGPVPVDLAPLLEAKPKEAIITKPVWLTEFDYKLAQIGRDD